MLQVLILTCALAMAQTSDTSVKPPVTVTRTELKVSRSLNPEDTQTLNVMTRDGSVAQLIVKRRDSKASTPTSNYQSPRYVGDSAYQNLDDTKLGNPLQNYHGVRYGEDSTYQNMNNKDYASQNSKAVFTNWIPLSSMYYEPKLIRLDTIAVVRNDSNNKPISHNLGNVIDSDR